MDNISSENLCNICFYQIENKYFYFSCSHFICNSCFPLFFINFLSENPSLFTNNKINMVCPLCYDGYKIIEENNSSLGVPLILRKRKNDEIKIVKNSKCFCKNEIIEFICNDCSQLICTKCMNIHKKDHNISILNEESYNNLKKNKKIKNIFILEDHIKNFRNDYILKSKSNFDSLNWKLDKCIEKLIELKKIINFEYNKQNNIVLNKIDFYQGLNEDEFPLLYILKSNIFDLDHTEIIYNPIKLLINDELNDIKLQLDQILSKNFKINELIFNSFDFPISFKKNKNDENYFKSEPKLQNDFLFSIIENQKMYCNLYKSNMMTIFNNNNETYLAYGIRNYEKNIVHYGDIEIFNVNKNQASITLSAHCNGINHISNYENKYLYSCSENLKIYNINDFSLKTVIKNNCSKNSDFLTSLIFTDKFNELFVDNSIILAYCYNIENDFIYLLNFNDGKLIKQINCTNKCLLIKNYESLKYNKNYFVIGLQNSSIQILDLKTGDLIVKFSNDYPSSFKIIQEKEEEFIYFIDYSNNLIKKAIISNENNSKIISENKISGIIDICIWNDSYLLISGSKYYMKLNTNDLKQIIEKSDELNSIDYVNIEKFKISLNNVTSECLAIYNSIDKKIKILKF